MIIPSQQVEAFKLNIENKRQIMPIPLMLADTVINRSMYQHQHEVPDEIPMVNTTFSGDLYSIFKSYNEWILNLMSRNKPRQDDPSSTRVLNRLSRDMNATHEIGVLGRYIARNNSVEWKKGEYSSFSSTRIEISGQDDNPPFISLHNHPTDAPFSITDIVTWLDNFSTVNLLGVVTDKKIFLSILTKESILKSKTNVLLTTARNSPNNIQLQERLERDYLSYWEQIKLSGFNLRRFSGEKLNHSFTQSGGLKFPDEANDTGCELVKTMSTLNLCDELGLPLYVGYPNQMEENIPKLLRINNITQLYPQLLEPGR